jgi:hypothetical protein
MSAEFGLGTLAAATVAALLVGCVVDSTPSSGPGGAGGTYPVGGSSSSGGAGSQPILADIDTNGMLIATPGQGIGVYVTYETGGHWTISWTCDTAATNLSCNFVVDATVSATSGPIQNLAGIERSAANSLTEENTNQQVEAITTTTTGLDTMTFDTTPGVIVTVSVALNAPVSFFFVQDNQVNGGYTGALTNPLMFQPTTP